MSKKAQLLNRKLSRIVKRALDNGATEEEVVGALEIVKCNVAIAAARATIAASQTKKNNSDN